MFNIVIIILCSVLYICSIIPYIKLTDGKIRNSIVNITSLIFLGVYGIIFPINFIMSVNGFNSEANIERYLNYDSLNLIQYFIAIFLVTHSFLFIMKLLDRKRNTDKGKKINKLSSKNKILNTRNIMIATYILFIIGVISDFLYLKEYGSYSNYLNYSKLLRSGVMLINNKFSFLMPFRNCILFSSFLFACLLRTDKKKFFNFLLLIISIVLSIRILYSNSGRLSFAIYLMLLGLAIFKKNSNQYIKLKTLLKTCGIIMFFGVITIIIGTQLGRNNDENIIVTLNKEISFAFLNFDKVIQNFNLFNYRYFFDIISFAFYLLPSSIWGGTLGISAASTLNTIAWSGAAKGTNGVYGEIPIDFVSLSYMQFGFLGIIFLPIAFAIMFYKLINIFASNGNNKFNMFFKEYIIIAVGIQSLFYADPYLIINRIFGFIVFCLIYWFLSLIQKRKIVSS